MEDKETKPPEYTEYIPYLDEEIDLEKLENFNELEKIAMRMGEDFKKKIIREVLKKNRKLWLQSIWKKFLGILSTVKKKFRL